ncbi:MFS transporter [Brevibacillus laterosporus]|uniref:MFS transporter n=1 Tax=Brevibacillus laterosporus TaxID=1465 RepID=A0AAP3G805_BRELA|nr:MFS transporter [Brevibacillus laterosporus]ATO51562.1 MFS transporter [Brevibacillus laterosporus DSM 25]MBG9805080.1 transporter [Brevibacillus laterosporus]MCR8980868.1 MFS transporter [Brevibacillus laterosporus]MCZ0808023.1 MFS transporter [Brevibacillus laterosporus]MCZ0826415.1 MFS transporter [Brevibacillus laterosporus]
MGEMKSLFTNKNFTLLMIGQVISFTGSIIQRFALSLYVLGITGSGTLFATVLVMSLIPTILLGPIAGVFADRFSRRNIMIVLDILCAIIVGMMLLLSKNGMLDLPAIYLGVILLSVFTAFYEPAVQASIPSLVGEKQLLSANSLNSLFMTLANMTGPILAGILYGTLGLDALLLINGISFLFAAILEMFMVIPQTIREKSSNVIQEFKSDLKEGFKFVYKSQYLGKLIFATLIANVFISPIFTVGIAYITKMSLKMSDQMYGLSEGVIMAGSLMAPIALGLLTKKLTVKNAFVSMLLLSGIFLFATSGSILPSFTGIFPDATIPFWIFTTCGFGIMASITILAIVGMTMLQNDTPNEMLGRVMALVTSMTMAAIPLGQLMYGLLFDRFADSSYIPMLLSAIVSVILSLYIKVSLAGYKERDESAPQNPDSTSA